MDLSSCLAFIRADYVTWIKFGLQVWALDPERVKR